MKNNNLFYPLAAIVLACLVCLAGCSGLAYTLYNPANSQIYWIDSNNPQPQPLFQTAQKDSMPDVSHDGKKVAFTRTSGSSGRIMVRNTSDVIGASEKDLTNGFRPRWSPNGEWILFTDQKKIFIMKKDGTARRQLTDPSGAWAGWADDLGHDFLNDNTIIFTRRKLTNSYDSVLCMQDVNGTEVLPILPGSDPVVSHDGRLLAFKGPTYPMAPATFETFYIFEISPSWRVKLRLTYALYPGAPPPPIPYPDTYGFSYDDARLLFSSRVAATSKYELLSLKVDCTDLQALPGNPYDARYPEGFKMDW
jgi:WD40-like Beta Propeller Repeat